MDYLRKDDVKMKKLKKILALILVATVVAACITGCGKEKSGNADGEPIKVVWWRSSGHDKVFMQEKFKEFNETVGKERGIELVYEHKDGDMEQMLDLAYTSDQAPDLFTTWKISMRAQQDQIIAFEDIKGMEGMLEKFGDNALEGRHQYKGKTYNLPITTSTYGLIYNKQMFKDAGIVDENGEAKPPVTWDEVIEDAKLLTNSKEQKYGIIIPLKWGGFYSTDVSMTASAINGITDGYNPTTGEYCMDGPIEVMKAYVHMIKDGSCVPGREGIDNDPARARFGQGNIGMKIAGSYDVAVLRDQFPAKIEWGVAPLPVIDTEKAGMQYASADGLFSVNKNSVERIGSENIAAIFDYFSSDEILTEMYQQGLSMPLNYNLIENAKFDNEDDMNVQNWKTFASFVPFSKCPPIGRSTDMTGEKSIVDIAKEILSELPDDAEIEAIYREYEKKANDGIKKYEELHPDYDPSYNIIKDWKLLR